MKKIAVLILSLYLSVCALSAAENITCYFSPKGGCTEAIVGEIGKAKRTISVQAYGFTNKPIAEALVAASKRGVKVDIILDKSNTYSNAKGNLIAYLSDNKIPAYTDTKHAIAHNKVMIFDFETVLTGSFNFTNAAEENNAENIVIIRNSLIASKFYNNFIEHQLHSKAIITN